MKKNTKRQDIIKSAYRLLRKKGANGTSLNEILEEATAGKSQLYHYFHNKEELIQSVLAMYFEKVYQETSRFMNQINNFEDFKKIIAGIKRLCKSDSRIVGCLLGSISSELAVNNEIIRVHSYGFFQQWQSLFSRGISRLQAQGILDPKANPDVLAEYFIVCTQGAMQMAKVYKDINIIDRILHSTILHLKSFET